MLILSIKEYQKLYVFVNYFNAYNSEICSSKVRKSAQTHVAMKRLSLDYSLDGLPQEFAPSSCAKPLT